ncbi:hypothetical protein V8B55DRAFT_1496987 [Mucor lusitanicus]|uniref:Uncharacterized protein n=2 Tax=Mucor circinelloides f. lusitanicus TaxID=29924 RepID=A0A162QSA7_MUCCL|nr:hypothetical protein FB192DRAFT_1359584 [Mucor lusitanicus]OAD05280.1 hypothetical protein MUCCIDRAFT_161975 [Mucor lusitanicus CBS 277.49]
MSKVSVKNDVWTPFQPIDQPQNSQKRKRSSAALKDSGNDKLVSNKRSKAKKTAATVANSPSSVTITKSVVWIGATLMQRQGGQKEEEEEQKGSSSIKNEEVPSTTAAFSVFYGVNDTRNFTERVSIDQHQNIDHVYIMGVIRALEKCEDDSSALSIHTGSKVLQSVLDHVDQDSKQEDSICQQIKEKIANRKGATSIRSAADSEAGYQAAHKLASERLLEVPAEADGMDIDVAEKDLVESLQVAESTADVSVTTTSCSTEEVKLNSDNTETIVTTTTVVKEETVTFVSSDADAEQAQQQTLPPPPSWAATLNLRNLLEILKAPFTRNK